MQLKFQYFFLKKKKKKKKKVSVLMDEHSKHINCSFTVSLHTLVKLLYILVVLLFIGEIKERSTEERGQLVGPRVGKRVRL